MVAVGVDTHKERHYAVTLDQLGQLLGECSFPATVTGYAELQSWAERLAEPADLVFGVEGIGSWGAGLCQHLQHAGHTVVEVERPRRKDRRAGKSDRIDALAAAKSVLGGEKVSTPRSRGILTALRALLIARRSAVAERTRLLNQLQALNATAPIALRERIGEGTGKQLERRVMSMRARASADVEDAHCVRCHARPRHPLTGAGRRRPTLRAASSRRSSAHSIARSSMNPASDRSQPPSCSPAIPPASSTRQRSLAATERRRFPASSGKTVRHRLNRGGDRQANNAIHTIAVIRAKHQPETRAYLDRRISEGKTKREAMRALKRHISRDLFKRLAEIPLTS